MAYYTEMPDCIQVEMQNNKNMKRKHYIYKLTLENGKFYIGKTTNIKRRMNQHFSGNGSMVTKKYKPLYYKIIDACDGLESDNLEHAHVKQLIRLYGYSRVRGGRYVNSRTF